MLYMCGTDLQSDCVKDMAEVAAASYGEDVQVVILAGGAKKWSDKRLTGGELNLFSISGGKWSPVLSWGKASMGKADTLVRFVEYCRSSCPADREVLILWDHGSSVVDGLCFDEVYNDDALTLKEVASAMSTLRSHDSGFHLDIVGADACLMACYEMAAVLAPYADYYVASEELEPYLGWYYTNWLNDLGSRPSMTDRELAEAMVDSYKYACERDDPNDYLTLSVIDLSKLDALTEQVTAMASILCSAIGQGKVSTISRTVQSCYSFGSYDEAGSDMIDMRDLISLVSTFDADTAAAARAALDEAVVRSYANSYVPSAYGMSIFVPMENSSYLNDFLSDYSVSAVTGYSSFVSAFAREVSGGSYVFTASGSTPYQMGQSDWEQGDSAGSAYGYSFGNGWNDWSWQDSDWWQDSSGWSWGYGYGSGYGYNNSQTL